MTYAMYSGWQTIYHGRYWALCKSSRIYEGVRRVGKSQDIPLVVHNWELNHYND